MINQRFPICRLPDDICLEVIKTMDHYEMISYSFVSKKAYAMVKSLRVSIVYNAIEMKELTEIKVVINHSRSICFKLTMRLQENDQEPTSFNDFPVSVNVSSDYLEGIDLTWSHQGLSLEQWIEHMSSIFEHDYPIFLEFYIGETRLTKPSFRNTLPKFKYIVVIICDHEPKDEDILYAENILRDLLPVVERARLHRVPLRKDFFVQHIGTANLKDLYLQSGCNVKFDDLLTLNVESLTIEGTRSISLRDLNRLFKLWIKGSFPKLNHLWIEMKTIIKPDWNVLLKGLKAKEVGDHKAFIIKTCRAVRAEIFLHYAD
ncbi:hypothetical protein B9Z55_011099 [Caenorhabditis nigoni]|uniref:F-box domain-containing protein n=1 Tax=Caenorhabditis nigoni TaxID=1611254 RepID=A0A2G5UIN2_9PELO|nr:hypothetical protein B9Z55_011099 [Caenorhabditis nigoni]